MVNYILTRHGYPMIVVRSRKKAEYLEALHATDLGVGATPSDGAHAEIKDIAPFLKYFTRLMAEEIYNDYLFMTEYDENVWWYDGEPVRFRSQNYAKILRLMRSMPSLTQKDIQQSTGISITAIQKLMNQLVSRNYIEKNHADGSWRVIISPSL